MAQDKKVTANRTYKSSVFTMVFQEKKELLELYNAVSGKHYEDPEELEVNTLDNAIYMSIKNDLSFIIDSRLSLYEHQSTYKNRAEVIKVCLYEYNQEEHMKFVREEGFRQGHEQGTKSTQLENIKNLMKNTGWNAKEAMKALGIPEEEQEKYQSKLQESKR